MLRARREKNGALVLSLDRGEAEVLKGLPGRLRQVLERPYFTHRVVQRLFPAAYKDPAEQAEYQKLLGDDLRRRKLEGVSAFETTLAHWRARGRRIELHIDSAQFDLWLGFVNDMRLLLGTELDIQEESWGSTFDPLHPQARDLALLHYLSWLEEALIQAAGP